MVRLYGLRQWVEQSFRQIKGELGFSDFQVRATVPSEGTGNGLVRLLVLLVGVHPEHPTMFIDPAPQTQPVAQEAGKKETPKRKNSRKLLRPGRWHCGKCGAGWTRG